MCRSIAGSIATIAAATATLAVIITLVVAIEKRDTNCKGDTVQKEKRLVSMTDLSGRETRFRKAEVSAKKTSLPHQHRRV